MYHLPTVPLTRPIRLAVLISGGGTTLDNFVRCIEAGTLAAEVVLVIASRDDCGGLEKAKRYGFPTLVVRRKQFDNVESFSETIFSACRRFDVDLVTLAGFLSLILVPDDFLGRTMNIHPSLIPAFCGAGFFGDKVHQAVYDRGVRVTGCTVHFADNQYDQGPIIVQKAVPVFSSDTPHEIARRVFEQECLAYPEAITAYAAARLSIVNDRVLIAGEDVVA